MITIDELKAKLGGMKTAVDDLRDALSIEASEKRLAELEHQMTMPGFYDDQARSQKVISEMGVEITPLIANCLYTGLATDTGCFRFSSTTANTHIVAAKLILAGAQVEELNTLLFDTKPRERMEAERIARNHLEYHLEGRCALMYLTRDEIEQSGVDPADLEELTSLPISIEGVKVGLLLRQQPGGSYRISVRTAKGVDACAIARRLGGGGHTRAAGCELLGNLDNTKSAILAEVEAELDRPETQEES